jgi:CRISPR/Cas system endoribonuclease Cas6 (RAMP superfamily)
VVPVPVRKEPNLRRYRELLSGLEGYPTVKRDGAIFLLAPEWRQFVDSGKAVKMGFDLEEEKVVKAANDPRWLEGKEAPAEVLADAKKAQEKKEVPVTVYSGWESVTGEGERKLRAKVAREVSGLDPVSFPAKQPSADDLPRF